MLVACHHRFQQGRVKGNGKRKETGIDTVKERGCEQVEGYEERRAEEKDRKKSRRITGRKG